MKKLIVANWKMNPASIKDAQKIITTLEKVKPYHSVVICPPTLYLPLLKTKFTLGAQNLYWEEQGAHTGEVSGSMLKKFKVKYVIIGHSERRSNGETDQQINLKLKAAIANGIQPILCVGFGIAAGTPEEDIMAHIQGQLRDDLVGIDPQKVIVAYEPVWAISSVKNAIPDSPEHAERIIMFIKIKSKVPKVLYGGSANGFNAPTFLAQHIDGLLVGGASLRAEEFSKMITTNI